MKKVTISKLGAEFQISDEEFKEIPTTNIIDKNTDSLFCRAKNICISTGNIYLLINEKLFEDIKEND